MLPPRCCVISDPKADTMSESLQPDVASGADLRRQRTRQGLTIRCTAQALGAAPNRISELERGIIHNSSLAERYQRHLAANPS